MLNGLNAVVTGSSSGIGRGIAKAFAARGMNVVMHGIEDAAKIEPDRADIEAACGTIVRYCQADMTRPGEIRELIRFADQELGKVDVLVNNAGIQFVAPIDEFPDETWDAIIAINLTAAFHGTKAVLPGMKSRGFGRVINIASVHGLVASPYKSAYVTAKHGIVGMTKTVALEVAEQGVTVNAICPGYVWTPLVEKQIPETASSRGISEQAVIEDVLLHAQATKKFVTIDQVASLACYLCADDAASITGAALSVDGGWSAA